MDNIAVNINNLTIKFDSHPALDNVSLDILEGQFITVVGPNGGGKSTLIKAIGGIIEPYSGSIKIFGEYPADIHHSIIGYVPQFKSSDRSFPALAIELVASSLTGSWVTKLSKESTNLAMEYLTRVGADKLAYRNLNELSGGELQRVFLARALVREPKLLLLDEPSTGIDSFGKFDINYIIDELKHNSKTTIIMTTHDWESAFHHSDFVLLINRSVICYNEPKIAFDEANMRKTFGHEGHKHDMLFRSHN